MNTIVALLKNIFTLNDDSEIKVGLSQFNKKETKRPSEQNVHSRPGDIKLSELMRKSY